MSFHSRLYHFLTISFLVLISLGAQSTLAHEARPVAIEITETGIDQFSVNMKVPGALPGNGLPIVSMSTNCSSLSEPIFSQSGGSYRLHSSFSCENGLAGQTLSLIFPGNPVSVNTLFQLTLQSGEYFSQLLSPVERDWVIPVHQSRSDVALQYTGLGIRHILAGVDHLLFLACLIFIAGSWSRILITVTGFTLAHSLTLFLSSLHLVNLPLVPVEAVIALSILFLAHEIAADNRKSWTWRYPVLVSSSFGLLHGFGFAAVLKEVGLPQTELVTGLLFFNLGVEIGQLLFIILLLLLAQFFKAVVKPFFTGKCSSSFRQAASYVIGTVAAYWFITRLLLM